MPSSHHNPEITASQTALLYRNAMVGLGVNTSVSALFAGIGYISRPGYTIIVWWLIMLGVSLARYQLSVRYDSFKPAPSESDIWSTRYIANTAAIALLWLIGSGLVMWGNSDSYRYLSALVLASMVAGAVPVLAPVKAAFRVYAITMVGGVVLMTFATATTTADWVFGVMILIFLAGVLRSANLLHDTLTESMSLMIEKGSLVQHLERAKEAAEGANKELQKTMVELDRLASTDRLTAAWNRRHLEGAVPAEMDRLRRYGQPLSQLVIDIDFFKHINDTHGHAVGDQVLVELACVVRATLRAADSLTRWGGEEFVVLCPNTALETAAVLAERLRERVANSNFPGVGRLTISIGAAECLTHESWDQWFARADLALYRAKANGRNQVQVAAQEIPASVCDAGVPSGFVELVWHDSYCSGDALIDRQHQALFVAANRLLVALMSGHEPTEMGTQLDRLLRDVTQHFTDEEAVISAAGFAGATAHAASHADLLGKATQLIQLYKSARLTVGELFQFLAQDLIAKHVLTADRAFFPSLGAKH